MFLKMVKFLLTVCFIFQSLVSAKTPHWVKNCSKSGPLSLDDCIVKRIRDAMPYVVPGYPKYRLPTLDPLQITAIEVDSGSKQIGLSLKMINTQIFGLRGSNFHTSKIDIPNRQWTLLYTNPRIEVIGKYVMDGKVLILPITGDGPGNITLNDVSGDFRMYWDYYEKNGKQYTRIYKSTMDFKVGKAFFNFKNLFNGDKALGAQMNNFLNENWSEVIREFGPAVGDAFNHVFRQLVQNGFDMVPFDGFFPE